MCLVLFGNRYLAKQISIPLSKNKISEVSSVSTPNCARASSKSSSARMFPMTSAENWRTSTQSEVHSHKLLCTDLFLLSLCSLYWLPTARRALLKPSLCCCPSCMQTATFQLTGCISLHCPAIHNIVINAMVNHGLAWDLAKVFSIRPEYCSQIHDHCRTAGLLVHLEG